MSIVKFNVSKMFDIREPWDCSNSVANMGPEAALLTWQAALSVAACHVEWLLSPLSEALDAVQDWAKETGAWDKAEREAWTDIQTLALFVQNVASDLRELGADDTELSELPAAQTARFERDEDVARTGLVLVDDSEGVHGFWYGGV